MTAFDTMPSLVATVAFATVWIVAVPWFWLAEDPDVVRYTHENLPLDHPHLKGERCQKHPQVVDGPRPR